MRVDLRCRKTQVGTVAIHSSTVVDTVRLSVGVVHVQHHRVLQLEIESKFLSIQGKESKRGNHQHNTRQRNESAIPYHRLALLCNKPQYVGIKLLSKLPEKNNMENARS